LCEHELDQFALWRLNTTYGTVYTSIGRIPAGASADAYTELSVTG
jgi:hypothetical protein